MALDTTKITKIRILAAKAETTTGVAAAIANADATLIVMDPALTRNSTPNPREAQGNEGTLASTPGIQEGKLTFKTEVFGSGTAATDPGWATLLLPACDYALDTGAYVATKTDITLTFGLYVDGAYYILYGAKGTVKLTVANGKPAVMEWEFTGKYKKEADAAILTPTLPTVIAPVGKTTVTFGAFAPLFNQLQIDFGNKVVIREDGGNVTGDNSGIYAAAITDKAPTGSIDPEATATATHDWEAKILASTEETLTVTIGDTAGNQMVLTASNCQAIKSDLGDRDGKVIENVGLQFNNNDSNTPFSITFP